MLTYFFLVRCDDIIVCSQLTRCVLTESEQDYHDQMRVVAKKIIKILRVPVLLWIQLILPASTCSYRFLQVLLIRCHLGMVDRIGDMLPPFLSHIDRIAIAVLNSPPPASRHTVFLAASHPQVERFLQFSTTLYHTCALSTIAAAIFWLLCSLFLKHLPPPRASWQ